MIDQVIGWKFNHQAGMRTSDGVITAFPGGIPSQDDQDLWNAEYKAHLESIEYSQLRKAEYDLKTVGGQLGMQYDDAKNGTTTWMDWQSEIKLRIKPNE